MDSIIISLPYHQSARILSDSPQILDNIKTLFGSFCFSDGLFDFSIEIKHSDSYFAIKTPYECLITQKPLYDLISIIKKCQLSDSKTVFFHGCSVAYNDDAYVFLSPSFGGKTTLVSFLCSQGYKYVTEDEVIVEKRTGMIVPCPTPIKLRSGGLEALRKTDIKLKTKRVLLCEGNERFVFNPENSQTHKIKIKKLFFSHFGTKTFEIHRIIDKSLIIPELIRSSNNPVILNDDYLSAIVKLSGIDCYYLKYNFLSDVIQLLR